MIKELEEQKLFNIFSRSRPNIFRYSFHTTILIVFNLFFVFMNFQSQIPPNFIVSLWVFILFSTEHLNNVTSSTHLLILCFPPLRNQCVTSTHILLAKASHMVTPNFKGASSVILPFLSRKGKKTGNIVEL